MATRFRKSIKIAPGVKLNINKKSVSVTSGTRGTHHTINSNGSTTTSTGIPGSGLSYIHKSSNKTSKSSYNKSTGYLSSCNIEDVVSQTKTDGQYASEHIESKYAFINELSGFSIFLSVISLFLIFFGIEYILVSVFWILISVIMKCAYYDFYTKDAKKILSDRNNK